MSKYIKNDDTVNHTWSGQIVTPGQYYAIQGTEEIAWMNNAQLLSDIGSGLAIVAKDDTGNSDITDVNEAINYLKNLRTEIEIDTEGRQIQRSAYGKKGWTYIAHPIEFTTSKLGAIYTKDWKGVDRGDCVFKFYDSSGTELVAGTQAELDANCVETRVTIKPAYDYEVISGKIEQHTSPSQDIRMWVVGGVIDDTTNSPWEYPTGNYHAKEFAGGINLKYMGSDQEIETDGRASKYMSQTTAGVPYQTNQFQFIIKHSAGYQHDLMIILEYFRA